MWWGGFLSLHTVFHTFITPFLISVFYLFIYLFKKAEKKGQIYEIILLPLYPLSHSNIFIRLETVVLQCAT